MNGAVTMLTSGNATGGGTVPQYITAVGGTVYFSGFDLTNREAVVVERRYGGDDGAADVGQRVAGWRSTRRC